MTESDRTKSEFKTSVSVTYRYPSRLISQIMITKRSDTLSEVQLLKNIDRNMARYFREQRIEEAATKVEFLDIDKVRDKVIAEFPNLKGDLTFRNRSITPKVYIGNEWRALNALLKKFGFRWKPASKITGRGGRWVRRKE